MESTVKRTRQKKTNRSGETALKKYREWLDQPSSSSDEDGEVKEKAAQDAPNNGSASDGQDVKLEVSGTPVSPEAKAAPDTAGSAGTKLPAYRSRSTTVGQAERSPKPPGRSTKPPARGAAIEGAADQQGQQSQQSQSQRMLQAPRKLMHQMSFRSMLSPSPSPSSNNKHPFHHHKTRSDATNDRRSRQLDSSEAGMGTLFGDAWIARPSATRRGNDGIERMAYDAPIYPISSRGSTLYEVSLDNKNRLEKENEERWEEEGTAKKRRTSVDWEYHQPDARCGWRVVGCAALACLVSLSTLLTYSVYQEYYMAANVQTATIRGRPPLQEADAATLVGGHVGTKDLHTTGRAAPWHAAMLSALIGGLMSASAAGFSLPAGLAADIVGFRATALAGTLLMTVGLFSSSFIGRLQGLCVTQGLVCGTGVAFILVPAYSVAPLWFDRHRALATGVAVASGGLGVVVLTPMLGTILRTYGMATSLQVHAMLVLVLGAAASSGLRRRIEAPWRSAARVRWRTRLADARIWAVMAMALFAAASRFAQLLCLPAFAHANGLAYDESINVLYALGASLAVGAIAGGLCADRTGYVAGLGLSELLMGAFTLVLWTPAVSVAPMYIYAVLYGLCLGCLAAVLPAAAAQMFGAARLASTIGLVVSVAAPAILASVPAAARFLDLADHHRSTAWLTAISGVLSLIAGLLGLSLPLLERRHCRNMVKREAATAFPS